MDIDIAWRDSARPVRLLGVDARLLLPCAAWILWPTWWTAAFVVLLAATFRFAEARGYRPAAAWRAVRSRLAGQRHALGPRHVNRWRDFG